MKNERRGLYYFVKAAGFVLFLVMLATCDVGLGPTVDTNAPTVTISTPTPSQVLKGSFSLGGVATDDGTIANVIVELTGLGSTTGSYSFEASVAEGKWSVSIDSTGSSPVADGTYQLKVTANDKSGKTSYQLTTFTVDNTAPVILVTSPDEKTSSLSYDLQFEGKIYDATEIDGINVNVYDASGNVKFSKAANLMGTSEWKVSIDGEQELLIGTALAKLANGEYTYSVTASDKVRNASSYFFHKEDIYKKYTKNRLSIDEWAAFDKGDKTTVSDVTLDRTEWLPSIRIPANPATAYADRTKFTYSDQPVASIVWNNISGETFLNNGDSIIGSITPPTGSDSPFRNDSFKCYIWKKEDTSGNLIANYNPTTDRVDNNKITITNIGTARSFSISTEGLGGGSYGIYIEIKNSSDTVFSDTQTFGINLGTPQLTINVPTLSMTTNNTSFALSGKALTSTGETGCRLDYELTITDEEGNSSTQTGRLLPVNENDSTWSGDWTLDIPDTDGTYAYVFTASSGDHQSSLSRTITLDTTNPTVKITSISQTDNASSIKATGTASDNLSTLAKLEYCFIPKNSTPVASDWKEPAGKAFYNWTISINNPVVNETTNELKYPEGEYTFHIRVTDVAGNVSSANESDPSETDETKINKPKKDITVDRADPQLTVSVEGNNWSWKTRKTVSIQVVETHFANTFVNSEGDNTYGLTVKLGDANAEHLSLTQDDTDTTKWTGTWTPPENIEDGTYSVTFAVTDTVGKTKTEKKTFVIDQYGPNLVVLNLEDGAVYTTGKTEAAPLTVMGTATDSPAGLKSLSYKVNSGEYIQAYPNTDYPNGVPLNWSVDISGLNEGDNTLSIKAVDNSDNETTENYSSIIIDTTAPELKDVFATSAPTYITVGGDAFKIITSTQASTVVAEDAIAIASFKVEATKDNTPQKSTTDADGHVVGEDASDDECWYSLTGISNSTVKKTLTVGDLNIPDFEGTIGNGVWVVTVTVKDKSGWEARKIYRFTVDTTKPVVRTIADIDAPKDMGAAPVSYMFSGTADDVDDSGSQVQKIEVAFTNKNGTIGNDTVIKTASGQTNWSYNLVFNDSAESNFNSVFATEGEKDIHVRAIDIAGNVGEWKTATFLYDKSAPTSSIISYQKENDESATTLTSASFNTGKKFTLTGKAFDSYDGIASVEVYQKNGSADDDTVPAVKIATISEFTDLADSWKGWSVVNLPREIVTNGEGALEATSNASVEDGVYSFYAVAMDKSGVTKTTEENGETVTTNIPGKTTKSSDITVTVDTTSPNVSITSPDNTRTGATSLYGSSSIFSVYVEDPGTNAVHASELKYVFVKAKVDDFETYNDPEPPATEPVLVSPNPAIPDTPAAGDWQSMNISDGSWSITQSLANGEGTTAANAPCSTNTLNEGHWYLFVKALDNAGNESAVESIHFHVDMNAPSISNVTVDSADAAVNKTYYTNGTSFALAGKATDTYGVKSVKIATSYTWIENTGTDDEPEETPHDVTTNDTITEFGTGGSWTKTIDVSADTAKDTPVSVTVTATDKAGKTTVNNYTLYRDTVAPEVTAISPANEENLNSNKIKLKGTVVDAGSGTASVSYAITREGDDEFSRTGSNIVPVGESWSVPSEINLGEGEGTFKLVVTAVDKVGNTSVADSLATRTNEFYVDTANPKIKETGINTASKMVKAWFTLSGYVYDSNSLNKDEAAVISADKTGFTDIKFKLPDSTANGAIAMTEATTDEKVAIGLTAEEAANQTWYKWSKTFCVDDEQAGEGGVPASATHLDDGTYVFSITANDVASKTAVVQRTITVDTLTPTFTPNAQGAIIDYSANSEDMTVVGSGDEAQTWFTTSVVAVKVIASDDGSGLSAVRYETSAGKSGFLMQSSEDETVWTTSIPLSEGTSNGIRIIAADAAGNEKIYPTENPVGTAQYEPILIDLTNPTFGSTINLTDNSGAAITNEITNSSSFTVSGTASDGANGSGVVSVAVTAVTDSDGNPVAGSWTMDGDSTPTNWKVTFNTRISDASTNKLSTDDTYSITITATDNAGLAKSVTKSIMVDTTPAPLGPYDLTLFTTESVTVGGVKWFGTTSLDVSGTVSDATSGINSVQWSWTEDGTYRSFDRTIDGNTCTFTGTVPVSTTIKNSTLYIKAVDKAGNESSTTVTGINVDLSSPTAVVVDPATAPLVNGQSDLTITVNAEDTFGSDEVASGVKWVKYKVGDRVFEAGDPYVTERDENNNFTITIPKETILAQQGIQSIVYIQAEDYTGKTYITSLSFQIDTNPPTAEITAPYTDDFLNKTIQFIGRADDDQDLLIVNLYYSTSKLAPGAPAQTNVWRRPMPTEEEKEGKTGEEIEALITQYETENLATETTEAKTKWILFKTFEGSNAYNWNLPVDTTDDRYNNIVDGEKHLHFMAEAYDAALNSAETSRKVVSCTIDQNKDCPVITLSNLKATGDGLLKSTQTVYGTIEDDDGNVAELRVLGVSVVNGVLSVERKDYWNDITDFNTWKTWLEANTETCTVRNGSWSYTFTGNTDGDKIIYFYVKDAKGNYFITPEENASGEALLRGVYISGTEDNPNQQRKPLKFRIDMNPPTINQGAFRILRYKAGDTLPDTHSAAYSAATSFEDNMILGGTNNLFDFFASAYDTNGIGSMSVKLGTGNNAQTISGVNTGVKDGSGYDIWRMSGFDVSILADNAQTLTITAVDGTGSDNFVSLKARIDNTAPDFSVTSHQTDKEKKVTGIITMRGSSSDALSNVASIKFMIPTRNSIASITPETDTAENYWTALEKVGDSSSIWKADLKGTFELKNFCLTEEQLAAQGSNITATDWAEREVKNNGEYTGYWKVPVLFRTEDSLGNKTVIGNRQGETPFYFFVNPDGDKPTAEIIYPATNSIAKLGGTIRIFGKAEDNEALDSVFIQIDTNGDDNYDQADLESRGYNFVDEDSVEEDENHNPIFESGKGYIFDDWWGIKVNGKESWNITINSDGKFNSLSSNTNPMKIRVRARDTNGTLGNWSEVGQIKIDTTAPRIGSSSPLKLVQFDNSGNITAMQDYQPDISIKGEWYLRGSAEDDNGIKSITITPTTPESVDPLEGVDVQVLNGSSWGACPVTDSSDYLLFRIPVNTAGSGTLSFEISVVENTTQELTATQNISIKYDNTAPSVEPNLWYNTSNLIGNGQKKTINGHEYNTCFIEQSNKTYSIEGTASDGEGGSGFSRVAIYFKRGAFGSEPDRIYNPVIEKDATGNKTNIDGSTVKLNADTNWLPSYTVTVESRTYEDKITLPGTLDPNIRRGGLVKIGGVYRLITDVTGNTVTFTPSVGTDYKTAEFVYALIIDNFRIENTEWNDDGSIKRIANDDGDLVMESIEREGTSYNWSISINSKNIPDGPIDICYMAFDNADNMSALQTVHTSVFNNRPAIANIWLGTDYDRSENVDESEFVRIRTVDTSDTNWKKTASVLSLYDKSDSFKAVGKTVIKPEIIGGNNGLNYYYAVQPEDDSMPATYTKLESSNTATAYVTESTAGDKTTSSITLGLSGEGSGTKLDGLGNGVHTYYFKIYDTTQNCIGDSESISSSNGSPNDSQWASFAVRFTVKVVDEDPPKASIKPLYWKSNSENSLYQNSTKNGHIELENDLPSIFNGSSGLMDKDPKVSGKIKIEGTAYDETCLQTIWIKVDGFPGLTDFTKLSTFTGGSWSTSGTLDAEGNVTSNYYFHVVSDSGVHSDGHKVKWELILDTSKITSGSIIGVGTDKLVQVKVYDTGNNPTNGYLFNATDAVVDADGNLIGTDNSIINAAGKIVNSSGNIVGNATVGYRMDVVPYITKITTTLSSLKKGNPSVYARTASGHYPVAITKVSDTQTDYEEITIDGYNLAGGTVRFAKDGGGTVDAASTWVNSNTGITIPENAKSGEVSIVFKDTNSVVIAESLNNKNNNDGKGGYTGHVDLTVTPTGNKSTYDHYYNRQPNGDNNNLLTDDVVLDVWEINPKAVEPINGKAGQPVMAINPVNHDVGFAFVNGALYYSMPNGSSYSYDNFIGGFDYWTSVGMAYDSLGNSYGTAAGGDINETKSDQFRIMTSRWGYADRDAGGYNLATNQLRLEFIGQFDYMENTTDNTYEGYRNFNKERIRSPSIATGTASSASTTVYLAYYDEINDEIRFKWGEFKTTKNNTWNNLSADNKTASLFGDYYGNTNAESGGKVLDDGNDYSKYRLVHNSWLAGQTSRVYNTSGNTRDAKVITTNGDPVYAGQYVSIAAIPGGGTGGDDAVVAVWWDAKNSQLLYSYNLTPKSIAVGQYTQADTKWTTPVPIFGSNIGEYCKVAVIKEGSGANVHYSVHIVGYDGVGCDVWYAYIPSFTNPSGKKTCLVDSYGIIGTELNIDVALDSSGNPIPYISYYAGSCAHPKTAHWAGTTSIAAATLLDSVDDEEHFTGVWEVSVIPTQSRVSIDHVNIGVWKDSTGAITWSTTNGSEPAVDNSNVGETKLDYKEVYTNSSTKNTGYRTGGHVWGNGSKNPILGYSVTTGANGFIETAQKK